MLRIWCIDEDDEDDDEDAGDADGDDESMPDAAGQDPAGDSGASSDGDDSPYADARPASRGRNNAGTNAGINAAVNAGAAVAAAAGASSGGNGRARGRGSNGDDHGRSKVPVDSGHAQARPGDPGSGLQRAHLASRDQPRNGADLCWPARFLVYMLDATRVGVSRKIGDRAERQRLREMVQAVLPEKSGGVIVRTVGEDATQATFKQELNALIGTWKKVKRKTHFTRAPSLVHRETSLTRGIIRDLFSDKVDSLTVDSKQLYNEIEGYLGGIAPDLIERVKLYEEPVPLFDKANIETEIRDLFKRRCDLPAGGYLIIEPTEALVSVDVNSGRYTGKKDPEKTILKTNLEAARELARQIRLRDVGGIYRLRLHRHGDQGQSRPGPAGASWPPRSRPGADESVLGERAGTDRDDAPAGAPEPSPEHDRAMPHVPRDWAGLHARSDRPPGRAVAPPRGGRRQA